MSLSPALTQLAEQLLDACRREKIKLVTAESCTGGLIAGCLTAVAGSSDVVERGFVTYSNEAKTEMLGVPEALIIRVGAVSEEVSRAMAEGALTHSRAARQTRNRSVWCITPVRSKAASPAMNAKSIPATGTR